MFGNQLGWILSFFIALAGVFVGYQLLQFAQPSKTTGWVQQTVLPLQAGDGAVNVLDPMNNLQDDAGALYRQAIADYQANQSAYEDLQKTKDFNEASIEARPGLKALVKAAACPTMDLFRSKPDDVVGFVSSIPELDDLDEISKTVGSVIALAKYEKRYDVASKYANALAALGYHLYRERLAYIELSAGENDLGTGLAALLEIAQAQQADDKINTLQQFDAARRDEYSNRIEPVMKVLASQGQESIGEHAGDMYQLAGDPQYDLVWRVEAIRKIGRLQFNAENRADQLKAPKFLDQLAANPQENPIVKIAANKARNMTSLDNQSQR
jgi:hypothetical protein